MLTNLVAAATCARLASAIVDYISKGHFREFLFGMEQHSLGEPWPDVLGVTIIIVVSILFMMGLEVSCLLYSYVPSLKISRYSYEITKVPTTIYIVECFQMLLFPYWQTNQSGRGLRLYESIHFAFPGK